MVATPNIQAKYLPCYEDPRSTPGFPGDCYPAEREGEAAVPESAQEAKARFKAAYARRNVCVRAVSRLQPGDANRCALAEQVIFLTEAIDHLEDVYAPIGFVAEPVMDDTMFTRDLIFTHAPLPRPLGGTFESSFSIYIAIPLGDLHEEKDQKAS